MRRIGFGLLAIVAVVVGGLGIVTLTTPSVEAIGCPPGHVPPHSLFCGGIAGIECPGNLVCIDDPRDNCCPQTGGADCGGVCVRPRGRR